MRGIRVVLVTALAALCCGGGTARGEEEGTKRIAVVNVSRVFDAYKKVNDVQDKLKNLFDPKRQELDKQTKDLRSLKDQIAIDSQSGNPETNRDLFEKIQKFQFSEFDVKEKFRKMQEEVEKVRMEEMKQVLKEIRAAIRELGQAEKYDLILRAPEYNEEGNPDNSATAENPEDQAPRSAGELVRRFRENPVLYFSKGVDLTQKVIARLNEEYAKGGKP